jgi:Raf kinase inhibitor-like YbhB/YbcL family protein
MGFKLSSPAFNHGSQIPSKYTCDGENISPHLIIHGAPVGTKSLALIMDDPDAPMGTWVHWLVWNISPEIREVKEHTTPHGSGEGLNSKGKTGYAGPCPPSGTHRYFFRLYALDRKLALQAGSKRADLDMAMESHILAVTELMGTYSRTNEAPR